MSIRGIYKITNLINNRVYIGESLDIYRRWDEHIEDLNNNKHHSYKLQKDWNEYGADKFNFEIVAVLDKEIKCLIDKFILIIYENKYIKEYDSIEKGYNIENTMDLVLNKEKVLFNNKDSDVLEGWIHRFKIGKASERNKIIYIPKYFGINDLKKKLHISKQRLIDSFLNNDVIHMQKVGRYNVNYSLSEEFKNNKDIILNSVRIEDLLLTNDGLEYLYNKLKSVI